jgi:hypothetical protein
MKTLPALAFAAALVAFVFLPVNFVVTGSLLFAAGLASIIVADYGHVRRPIGVQARARRLLAAQARRTERFGLAA